MRRSHVSLAAVSALLLFVSCDRKAPVFPRAPVVLISIDTLRADHLPVYGYHAVETPALDALARDAQADHESATLLARLFPAARSLALQRSIASVLLRADLRVLGGLRLGERLREHRLRSPEGRDIIDVLIDRLAAFDAGPAALAARH
jgi:hypothetical protein